MPKRTRRGDSDSDTEYTAAPRARRRTTKAPKLPPASPAPEADADSPTPQATSHSVSRHVLSDPSAARDALLAWYERVAGLRGMPWRKPYDAGLSGEARAQRAYEVWVSEIMLQQTQVATVIPYYNKWMERFPTLADLAAANLDTVHALWKGLGYYSRATRLLAGAQQAVADLGGALPSTAAELQALVPGIGRYSAGAISSIAYGEHVPAVDGNAQRVLSRVLALHAPVKAKKTQDILWAAGKQLVEGAAAPGDVNQSIIELGATLCTPRSPSCPSCPLLPHCSAATLTSTAQPMADIEDLCTLCTPLPACPTPETFPPKAVRTPPRKETVAVSVLTWHSRVLLLRRPATGLLASLYDFPSLPNTPSESTSALLERVLKNPAKVSVVKRMEAGEVEHVFSHVRVRYVVVWVEVEGGEGEPEVRGDVGEGAVWVDEGEVERANIGTGVGKVWKVARKLWA